jgi:hypothetical protein
MGIFTSIIDSIVGEFVSVLLQIGATKMDLCGLRLAGVDDR